jgi:hypothetical protein
MIGAKNLEPPVARHPRSKKWEEARFEDAGGMIGIS